MEETRSQLASDWPRPTRMPYPPQEGRYESFIMLVSPEYGDEIVDRLRKKLEDREERIARVRLTSRQDRERMLQQKDKDAKDDQGRIKRRSKDSLSCCIIDITSERSHVTLGAIASLMP